VKTAVIMQPTFLPWMGYFSLIEQADVFVFLTDVQFTKQSWQQRNRIRMADGREHWLTVPVQQHLGEMIFNTQIDSRQPWRRKHLGLIRQEYARARHFRPVFTELEKLYESTATASLSDFNMTLIRELAAMLGIQSEFVDSRSLNGSDERSQRLVDICKQVGATRYLSPVGSAEYLESDGKFRSSEIELVYQNFAHPAYEQGMGEFQPKLSVIDAALHCGFEDTAQMIRSGTLPPLPNPPC
jgi:hypothetical protein